MAGQKGDTNIQKHISYGAIGIDSNSSPSQMKEGTLCYALNAVTESYDGGNQVNYQNETGNTKCITFPEGYSVIGTRVFTAIGKIIYLLVSKDNSQIGYSDIGQCVYHTLIESPCLNFSMEHPVHRVVCEVNGDSQRIYWADNYNPDRYLDLNNLPYKRIKTGPNACDYTTSPTEIDCNLLRVQAHFNIPYIEVTEVTSGGQIVEGTYQFGIQYSDAIGTGYTGVYNITNPVPIFANKVTQDFNSVTDKAISLNISNLDTERYTHYNLIVVKSVNNISTPQLVGTYSTGTSQVTYTGEGTPVNLSADDIFQEFPIYEKSDGVTTSDDVLIRYGVTEAERVNYQSIASQIRPQWVLYQIPYTTDYSDPVIAEKFRGYMGNEVYALEFQPILRSGKKCDGFHIPGREPKSYDTELVDNPLVSPELCSTEEGKTERWRVENTAIVVSGSLYNNTPLQQDSELMQEIDSLEHTIYVENSAVNGVSEQINQGVNNVIDLSKISKDSSEQIALSLLGPVGIVAGLFEKGWHSLSYELGTEKSNELYNLVAQNPVDEDAVYSLISPYKNKKGVDKVVDKIMENVEQINALHEILAFHQSVIATYTQKLNDLYLQYNSEIKDSALCTPTPIAYGDFGYYQSEELYPCNEEIWGDLAGKPIRHHRFPKRNIHDDQGNIYPLGIRIDHKQVVEIIKNNTSLTQEQKDDIVGYKILRANRVGHKSVIAKGLINNVGIYTKDKQTYFYPNYPYNDVRPDPFLCISQTKDDSGDNASQRLNGFYSTESKKRFTFSSPDTSFYQPNLGDHIEIESIEYGNSKGHFVPVKEHPRYQIPSRAAYATAVAITMGLIAAGSKEGIGPGGLDIAGGAETNWEEGLTVMLEALDIIQKSIPHKELAYQYNSIGEYAQTKPIPGDQRTIFPIGNNSRYVSDGMANVEDVYQLNNYLRGSSVYLKTEEPIPFTHDLFSELEDKSRYISSSVSCDTQQVHTAPISSYYTSLRRNLTSQYGQIYSYETIDTGYYCDLSSPTGTDIFGGDVYISKFAYKNKHSFFTQNLVGRQDNLALDFRNYSNYAYPTYWLSNERDGKFTWGDLLQEAASVLVGAAAGGLGSMSVGGAVRGAAAGGILGAIGVLLDNWQNNFDCAGKKFFYQDGKFYLFSYGIPYFYVESEVNCNYRQAFNSQEGDFYPHTGTQIPDDWLQEINTPIVTDNTYFYNKTFSKQNKEAYFHHLPEDYTGVTLHPNRAVYSEKQASQTNYKINNWLLYRPLSYFDFPQTNGKLTSLDTIENRAILARFENKMELYDAMLTINTSNPQAAYIGNTTLFRKSPPIEFADSDVGYAGSQHKFFQKTPYGNITVDAQRGNIFLVQGTKAKEISGNISKFLQRNLPLQIATYFPGISIDNNFNGIGLHGTYDPNQNRLILTKLDYTPKMSGISYTDGQFVYNNQQIQLSDTTYFENKSFTLSYHFPTQSWISYHSYLPLYYIGTSNLFYSGIHTSLWAHDPSLTIFNSFYSKTEPYIIEYPFSYKYRDEILQAIQDYTKVYAHLSDNPTDAIEVNDVYFDEAILYSNQQCSGTLKLSPKPKGNMREYMRYPLYSETDKTILYTKSNQYYQYNTFWSLVKNHKKPLFVPGPNLSLPKVINNDNMDYSKRSFKKEPLTTPDLKVRHTLNTTDQYRLVSQFLITQTQQSYK